MGRIFDAVHTFLDGEGIKHQLLEGATALRFGFKTEENQWICMAEVREAQDVLLFASILPKHTEEAHRAAMAELLTRINYGLTIGNFEMNYEHGEVRYRTSLDLEGSEVAPTLIRQLLYANLSTVSRYIGLVERVAAGEASPVEALATLRG